MPYTVRVEGLAELQRRLNEIPTVADRELEAGVRNIGDVLVVKVQEHTIEDTGRTKRDISAEYDRDGKTHRVTVAAHHTEDVVVASISGGTKPHWPPWGPGSRLAGWAARKEIPVFLVARAIANFGTIKRFGRPRGGPHMFDKGLADSRSAISDEVKQIGVRTIRGVF
jgi:hypothetical protein